MNRHLNVGIAARLSADRGELTAYFDEVLTVIKHPVTLAPNPIQGYPIKPRLIADLCNRYP